MADYKQLRYFLTGYAGPGIEDRRALESYIECETREAVSILRAELIGIKNGNFDEEIMKQILGPSRLARHTNYIEWAKVMLIILAERSKG